jgi:hypothetical protein
VKISPDDAGAWVDSSRGIYASSTLVEIALGFPGFLKQGDRRSTSYERTYARHVVAAYNRGEDETSYRRKPRYGSSYTVKVENVFEQIVGQGGYADMAADFLNTLAPEGYSFGWWEGDFMLQSAEWWDEEAA